MARVVELGERRAHSHLPPLVELLVHQQPFWGRHGIEDCGDADAVEALGDPRGILRDGLAFAVAYPGRADRKARSLVDSAVRLAPVVGANQTAEGAELGGQCRLRDADNLAAAVACP